MEIQRKGMAHLNPIMKGQIAGKAEKPARQDLKPRQKAERVDISQQAKSMSKGMDILRAAPDVRADLVVTLKALIESGEYKVDGKKLAEAILDNKIMDF